MPLFDTVQYLLFRAFVGAINFFPLKLRLEMVTLLIRFFVALSPRYQKIVSRNLLIAFPERDALWHRQMLKQACRSLARVVVDMFRLHKLDRHWVTSHVEFSFRERYRELRREHSDKGMIIVSGHLGSFELYAPVLAHFDVPCNFVMRDFASGKIGAWWRDMRIQGAHRPISRKGAFKEVMRALKDGGNAFVLFDQNVKKSHAVFVNWFSRPAATTKLVAIAALRTQAPVIVMSIAHKGRDLYSLNAVECDLRDLYADDKSDIEQKLCAVTQRISDIYSQMIRDNPGEWFWFHRRWKTCRDSAHDGEMYR